VHTACKREAIAVFMELSFKDDNQELQERLVVINFSFYPSRPLPFCNEA
jgi:hypothetical protein